MPARIGARRFGGGLPAPSLDIDFRSGVLDPRITFTRASSKATVGPAGTLVTAGTDVPAFSWDPVTLAPLGINREEARTNLLLNSGTLGTQNVTTTAVAHALHFTGTGTITLTGTSTAGPLVGTGTGEGNRVQLLFTPTAGTLTLTVTGTVTNAQLEAGAFRTSYIATTGATVTRAEDLAAITGTNFSSWYNPREGTFVSRVLKANLNVPWSINDGGLLNRLHPAGNTMQAYAQISATAESGSFGNVAASPTGATFVEVVSYRAGRYAYANSSGFTGTATFTGVPAVNQLQLGNITTVSPLCGTMARLTYYPVALTDSQILALAR